MLVRGDFQCLWRQFPVYKDLLMEKEERPQPGAFSSTLPTGTSTSPRLPQPPPQHGTLRPLLWKTQIWVCHRRHLALWIESPLSFRHMCLEERKTIMALILHQLVEWKWPRFQSELIYIQDVWFETSYFMYLWELSLSSDVYGYSQFMKIKQSPF